MNQLKYLRIALAIMPLLLIGTFAEGIETNRMRGYDFVYRHVETTIYPRKPKLGDVITVSWKINIDRNIPEGADAQACIISKGGEIIGEIEPSSKIKAPIQKGTTLLFIAKVKCVAASRINKPGHPNYLSISVSFSTSDNINGRGISGSDISLFLIDEKTGQLATSEDIEEILYGSKESRKIYMLYNHLDGEWLREPDQQFALTNKKITEEMKKFEPTLSDSEALCLHADNFKLIINAIGDPTASDEERIKIMLAKGWLDAIRKGGSSHEKWLKDFMRKNKGKWDRSEINPIFFRDGYVDNSVGNISDLGSKVVTTFLGNWSYQDHVYDKDNGLQFAYNIKPVINSEVAIKAYWSGQGTITVGWGTTDNSGNFFITTDLIPSGATSLNAYPLLYAWGPDRFDEKLKVADPTPTFSLLWRNPRDTTIWVLGRSDGPPANSLTPGSTCDFGICYPETATVSRRQPRSGAINIYETLLHARTFSTPPSWNLRTLWEPNYQHGTGYSFFLHDTLMYVQGDTIDSDEWDDDHLYHEYGHFLMNYYEGHDSWQEANYNPNHQWNIADSIKQATAWIEGWANYFSGRARVGSGVDSLYVNNRGVIDAIPDTNKGYYYFNLENPWDFKLKNSPDFQPNEYTEGSVAGILFDIYDSYSENPYPADPTRSDIISRGDDEIWSLMDSYDPPGAPPHIYGIRHFRTGWTQYNYGDESEVNSIYEHHGVISYSAPSGLSAIQPSGTLYAALSWAPPAAKSSKTYIGYNVYRKGSTDSIFILLNGSAVTDTFYNDNAVEIEGYYNYYVTTVDAYGYESAPSNIESLKINPYLHSTSPLATAYNNAKKLVCDTTGANLHLIYQSNNKIWYAKSGDGGNSWGADTSLGEGQHPAIFLDRLERPGVLWTKKINNQEAEIFFCRFTGAGWTGPVYLSTFPLGRVAGIVSDMVPGFAISKSDTAFISWLAAPPGGPMPLYDILYAGWFDINNPATSFQYSPLDSLSILAYRCPSVSVDTTGTAHFAWDDNPPGIAYRKRGAVGNFTPKEFISQGPEDISPCLDYSRWQNTIDVVWEGPVLPEISYRSKAASASVWGSASLLDTMSVQPVIAAGGYAVFSKGNEIFYKRKIGSLWPDSTLKNISNTAAASDQPQACFSQTVSGSNLYVTWTEGNAAPYQVNFAKISVPAVAKVYVNTGDTEQSAYCLQRDGHLSFGPESYKTVDYDSDQLKYRFDGLNKDKKYSIKLIYYCEYSTAVEEVKAVPGRVWIQELDIDGTAKQRTRLMSSERIAVEKNIPPAAYNKDGEIVVDINRISGDYAVCAEIFLYEYDKEVEEGKSFVAKTAGFSPSIPLTNHVFQNAPNPFGHRTSISYQLAHEGQVSLKVYNIAGQLVNTLIEGFSKPGVFTVSWDGRDDNGKKVANGVYLYRLNTKEYSKTMKLAIIK